MSRQIQPIPEELRCRSLLESPHTFPALQLVSHVAQVAGEPPGCGRSLPGPALHVPWRLMGQPVFGHLLSSRTSTRYQEGAERERSQTRPWKEPTPDWGSVSSTDVRRSRGRADTTCRRLEQAGRVREAGPGSLSLSRTCRGTPDPPWKGPSRRPRSQALGRCWGCGLPL